MKRSLRIVPCTALALLLVCSVWSNVGWPYENTDAEVQRIGQRKHGGAANVDEAHHACLAPFIGKIRFALPPLVLYTFYAQDATAISRWAQSLKIDSNVATFFNMLDTHDGVGVMGVKGILEKEDPTGSTDEGRSSGLISICF